MFDLLLTVACWAGILGFASVLVSVATGMLPSRTVKSAEHTPSLWDQFDSVTGEDRSAARPGRRVGNR